MSEKQLVTIAEMVQKLLRAEPTKILRDLQYRLERDYPRFKSKFSKEECGLIEDSINSCIK
jgi:hypothetical protein